jgi:hypothetical protein
MSVSSTASVGFGVIAAKGLVPGANNTVVANISGATAFPTNVTIAALAAAMGSPSYQGTWNASTNTPTLVSSVGTNGNYYVVSVAGTTSLNGVSDWSVGDWVIFNGTTSAWQKIEGGATTITNGTTAITGSPTANGIAWNNGGVFAINASATVTAAGVMATASLALGGAAIGSNALAVTGTSIFSSSLTIGVGTFIADADVSVGSNGYFRWGSRGKVKTPADGVYTLLNNAETDFGRLQFGGTTSSFPAIKRNGAGLDVRLADDSNYALLTANNIASIQNVSVQTGAFFFTSKSAITNPGADGTMMLSNNAQTDFGRLQFGGTTSSFPALKRSAAVLQARLADDSAYADFYGGVILASDRMMFGGGNVRMAAPSDGVATLYNSGQTDFGRLQFGGTTSSFPAIKRSGAILIMRTADDSADADFAARGHQASSNGNFGWATGAAGTTSTDTRFERVSAGIVKLIDVTAAEKGFALSTATDAVMAVRNRANNADAALTAASISTSATNFMHITSAALANGAAAQVGTLTNSPTAGNPTKWVAINDNGTTRYIPAW